MFKETTHVCCLQLAAVCNVLKFDCEIRNLARVNQAGM